MSIASMYRAVVSWASRRGVDVSYFQFNAFFVSATAGVHSPVSPKLPKYKSLLC